MATALAASYAAVVVVLLPNQVAALDPANKVANLALVSTVAFALTIVAQPLVGALSDRTRSPLGRRAPWALGGALVAAAALLCLGGATSLAALGALWVVAQFALNALDIAASAVVPDEVPSPRRGRTFAVIGAGAVAGGGAAVLVAGRHADDPQRVYVALAVLVLVASAVFVLAARPRRGWAPAPASTGTAPRDGARRAVSLLRSMVVDPRKEPLFAHAFASRFLFVLAYNLVYTYQLFILTDHLGLATDRANRLLGLLTIVSFVAILVSATVVGRWSDRVGNRVHFMVGACAVLAAALLVPLVSPTVGGMVTFAVLKGIAFGAHIAAGNALVTDVLPDGGTSPGKDLGIYNVATNIPQTVAPAVAGMVITHLGGYAALFVVASGVACAALLLGRRVQPGTDRPAPGKASRAVPQTSGSQDEGPMHQVRTVVA
ncbi:MFS transporter [Sanguibacter sp. 25GB23B1]|uniref:MFS transporter n=1 Tax=unclassified Sanguibacter TaxID=2645534 RepID=UPI0032AF0F61